MEETPRYATLQDYLRVVRRHRTLVLGAFALGALIALLVSITQEKTYEATAQVSFRDVEQDANLIGGSASTSGDPPAQRAAANAELLTRPEVTVRAQEKLGGDLSPAQLAGSITTRVGVQTNLVIITARADDSQLAADIANAYAESAKEIGSREVRQRLGQLEESTSREIDEAEERGLRGSIQFNSLLGRLSLIRTLRQIAEPVEVAAAAQPPAKPVSPRPVRNTVLGALLGLIVGLVAAFVRDSFDHRLHSSEEAHRALGGPVLGRIPEGAFGYAGPALNGRPAMGVAEFEAFRMLRMNLAFLGDDTPVRTILVTSGLPGEGKSTVSMSLAAAAVLSGQRVLLVECDLRRPAFADRLGIQQSPGLTDYLHGRVAPSEILQTIPVHEPGAAVGNGSGTAPSGTLVCITGGAMVPGPAELLMSERFKTFIDKVRKAYDLVVLDSSPLLSVVDPLQLVPHVDGILVCARIEQSTREQVRAARAALSHLPARPVGVVVTGLRPGGVEDDYYYG